MSKELYERLKTLSLAEKLPEHEYIFSLADKASLLLENEVAWYRAASKNGKAGGLLDFTSGAVGTAGSAGITGAVGGSRAAGAATVGRASQKPVILVPDLHARSYFLQHILDYFIPSSILNDWDFASNIEFPISVFEALEKGLVRVVCVGDLLHSELRGRLRWYDAEKEFSSGNYAGPVMTEEMKEGLNLLCMVMELKCAFPENFHVLKGNHENIMNESGNGNYSFGKFANEGEMCRCFMEEKYGDDVLYVVSCFEKSLPLFAAFDSCVVSHAEPLKSYTRKDLVDGLCKPEVIKGLTWTENGASEPGSVEALLSIFTDSKNRKDARYFGGHRPVKGKYALRQNGYYVQFHNPEAENVVLVNGKRPFNLEKDIVSVVMEK